MTQAAEIEHLENFKRVHNHGFVGIDREGTCGSDQLVERAARMSYQYGTDRRSKTRGLIRYLFSHRHSGPFEFPQLCFHIRLPIFVMRQLIRHRTMSFNEESARYSILHDNFFVPELEDIRFQSQTNKQGRGEIIDPVKARDMQQLIDEVNKGSYGSYEQLLEVDYEKYDDPEEALKNATGLTRELARIALPVSIYTECMLSVNLHNFLRFATLRCDHHAQKEIRDYANVMVEFARPLFPLTLEAWDDYVVNARGFSRMELNILGQFISRDPEAYADWILQLEARTPESLQLSKREKEAFMSWAYRMEPKAA